MREKKGASIVAWEKGNIKGKSSSTIMIKFKLRTP